MGFVHIRLELSLIPVSREAARHRLRELPRCSQCRVWHFESTSLALLQRLISDSIYGPSHIAAYDMKTNNLELTINVCVNVGISAGRRERFRPRFRGIYPFAGRIVAVNMLTRRPKICRGFDGKWVWRDETSRIAATLGNFSNPLTHRTESPASRQWSSALRVTTTTWPDDRLLEHHPVRMLSDQSDAFPLLFKQLQNHG